MTKAYLYLIVAILAEAAATTLLKKSDGFTRWLPSAGSIVGYLVTFYFLSLSLRVMNVGIANAIWAGLSIILVCILAAIFYGERLDAPAIIGIAMIMGGIVLIHFYSKTVTNG